jgi:hypothetical protein
MSRDQEPGAIASERLIAISQKRMPLPPNPRKTALCSIPKRIRPTNDQRISIREYARFRSPCLNKDIPKLQIKAPRPMRLHVRKEITHSSEMLDKIFDIDMSVCDIAGNPIETLLSYISRAYLVLPSLSDL